MRGLPLIRAQLVLLAVAACGMGLAKLTNRPNAAPPEPRSPPPAATLDRIGVPFDLALSHPARSIRLDPGIDGGALDLDSGPGPHDGSITLDSAHRIIFIDIEWSNPPAPGIHRFAKLTLEPPNQPTLTRTFDTTSSLSDVWELPSP